MNFKEAFNLHKRGFKVRRESWPNKKYWLGKVGCIECGFDIEYEDAIADDWEVIGSHNK